MSRAACNSAPVCHFPIIVSHGFPGCLARYSRHRLVQSPRRLVTLVQSPHRLVQSPRRRVAWSPRHHVARSPRRRIARSPCRCLACPGCFARPQVLRDVGWYIKCVPPAQVPPLFWGMLAGFIHVQKDKRIGEEDPGGPMEWEAHTIHPNYFTPNANITNQARTKKHQQQNDDDWPLPPSPARARQTGGGFMMFWRRPHLLHLHHVQEHWARGGFSCISMPSIHCPSPSVIVLLV